MIKTFIALFLLHYALLLKNQDATGYEITFDKNLHDFGIIYKGSRAECVFSFINKSDKPVAITSVKASCGCTVPVWSKNPVKPDGSGTISVRYNTNITGTFYKTITILTTGGSKSITLAIRGEVKKKARNNTKP